MVVRASAAHINAPLSFKSMAHTHTHTQTNTHTHTHTHTPTHTRTHLYLQLKLARPSKLSCEISVEIYKHYGKNAKALKRIDPTLQKIMLKQSTKTG